MTNKMLSFPDGAAVPVIGQGTWGMGESHQLCEQEVRALQCGIDCGLTLIDTAEMYAEGGAEQVVGRAIDGRREQVYLVSKVYPHHAGGQQAINACENSLRRLQTDYLDLYLLHWRGGIPLVDTVRAMESLQQAGKIRHWGVSNLDCEDMQELWRVPGGEHCATNQVLYHLASRGIEFDLLPWCRQRDLPLMAYCPLAQAGRLRDDLFDHPLINEIAAQRALSVAQILLAWVIHRQGVLAIPKASSERHVRENAALLTLELTPEEIAQLEQAFPAPRHKVALDIV
ncbi:aldo/keto reductase [Affinibrenneria salicis]|uniref:Aldo/keto reductase n=1 Tax=Affinibrenneria salicis TaxID=2590031 RepID=A0A5J5G440_9GAMM|nr:aldo/keto reductase [Affinibrenneria salicis]KAA9001798.1 aldo/keto reductase [Affinibrenneria salicis]